MLAENIELTPHAETERKASFFRQSGWLMIANIAGGMLMWAVHFLANRIGPSQYGLFITLLTAVMLVPAIPLQMVFAQQTARALATGSQRELAGLLRFICLGTFAIWALLCIAVLLCQNTILNFWGITDAVALWITMPILLVTIWAPVFMGILQGQQNFLWLGWSMMSGGIGRLGAAAVAVLILGQGAAGMMVGVLAGALLGLLIAVWQTRGIWLSPPQSFAWRGVLRQIIPLLFGFIFVQFLFTGDTLFVKHYFTGAATGAYGSAGTLSRALIWLVGPLATVMFPRIVHSSAKSEHTNIMGMVLLGTAVLSIGGAAGLAVLGRFVIALLWGKDFVMVAGPILPWYALAMVPLALANVLVNNLLARSQFKIVPVTFLLSIAYAVTMVYVNQNAGTLIRVLQTLGVFNLLFLGACAWFTWAKKVRPSALA
ncbi:MAG TPA: lipid II flippase MurJ [Patescibacteria group bacterium]|nr:lipid II flippase MurJ [Patescibacteria group bacterium]